MCYIVLCSALMVTSKAEPKASTEDLSISIYSIWWRYTDSVYHQSCYPF
jgi:hypothetical protein